MIRTFKIDGDIDVSMLDYIIDNLEQITPVIEKFEKIYLYINSDGGDLNIAYHIIDLLTPYKDKITTIALDSCKSCATMIFLIGKERLVTRNCSFLMHRISYIDDVFVGNQRITAPFLKAKLKELLNDEKKLKKFYKRHKVPRDLLNLVFSSDNDVIVTTNALIKSKIATGIIEN